MVVVQTSMKLISKNVGIKMYHEMNNADITILIFRKREAILDMISSVIKIS